MKTEAPRPLNSSTSVANSSLRHWLSRFCLGLALLGACVLGLSVGKHLPGCGQGCNEVANGVVAHLFGDLSVAWSGAAVYLLTLLIHRDTFIGASLRATVVAAAAGALLVMFFTGQYCLWCIFIHLIAVAAIFIEPGSNTVANSRLTALTGLASVGIFAVIEWRVSTIPPAPIVADVSSSLTSRHLLLHGGKFSFSPVEFPCLGSPDANTIAVVISDYTCGHCYDLKKTFKQAVEKAHGKLGAMILPASRGEDSRDIQRNMRALWLADPVGYTVVDAQLVAGKIQADRPTVKAAVAKQLGGEEQLAAALALHGAGIDATLAKVEELLAANEILVGTRNLPQYIAADRVYVGGVKEVETLLAQALGQYFEDDHPLVFEAKEVNLGRVVAGTGTNYALVMKNRGPLPIRILGIQTNEAISISGVPEQPILAGKSASYMLHLAYPRTAMDFDWIVQVKLADNLGSRELHIKGSTWAPWSLSAETFSIKGGAPFGKSAPNSSAIDINLSEALELSLPNPSLPHAKFRLERGNQGKSWRLLATPAPTLAPGLYSGEIPIAVTSLKPGQALPEGWPPAFSVPYSITLLDGSDPQMSLVPQKLSTATR